MKSVIAINIHVTTVLVESFDLSMSCEEQHVEAFMKHYRSVLNGLKNERDNVVISVSNHGSGQKVRYVRNSTGWWDRYNISDEL